MCERDTFALENPHSSLTLASIPSTELCQACFWYSRAWGIGQELVFSSSLTSVVIPEVVSFAVVAVGCSLLCEKSTLAFREGQSYFPWSTAPWLRPGLVLFRSWCPEEGVVSVRGSLPCCVILLVEGEIFLVCEWISSGSRGKKFVFGVWWDIILILKDYDVRRVSCLLYISLGSSRICWGTNMCQIISWLSRFFALSCGAEVNEWGVSAIWVVVVWLLRLQSTCYRVHPFQPIGKTNWGTIGCDSVYSVKRIPARIWPAFSASRPPPLHRHLIHACFVLSDRLVHARWRKRR